MYTELRVAFQERGNDEALEQAKALLQEAQIGFAGEQTAIGDAIGLAIKRLRARPDRKSVV
mgnify:CR=1 FL=1